MSNRTLLSVSTAIAITYIGIGMVVPVRVLYAQSRGASLAIIGAMGSAFLLANFLFQYPSGWSADRWGRKRVMVLGLGVQSVLSLVYLVVTNPIVFVVLRFVEGMAGAAILPPARALIADSTPPDRRGQAYGIFSSFFNAGLLVGPALGGLLATTGYSSAFIASFFFRLAAMVVVILLIEGRMVSTSHALKPSQAVGWRMLFSLPLVGAYILMLGDSIFLGFDLTLLPLWMQHHLGASVALVGLAYAVWAVPNVLMAPIGGRIADRRRRSTLILVFGLIQVPIYTAYGLVTSLAIVLALFVVHGAIYALMQPSVDSFLAAASPAEARARVQSVYTGIGLASSFVAAIALPLLYGTNFRLPLFVMAAGFAVSLLVGGTIVRISERRAFVPVSLGSATAAE
ncbi:MAG TPA: MFS transporter [Chloroflexota bacterium]